MSLSLPGMVSRDVGDIGEVGVHIVFGTRV
jgi:hypothetical protein